MADLPVAGASGVDLGQNAAVQVEPSSSIGALDLSADYLIFDGLEQVKYRQGSSTAINKAGILQTTAPVVDSVVPHALLREVNVREVEASAGRLRIGDVRVELPLVEMEVAPLEGDEIERSDGTLYKVLGSDICTLRSRYRVFARK